MGLWHIKEKLSQWFEKTKSAIKKSALTAATALALTGALASCNTGGLSKVHLSKDGKVVSTEFQFVRSSRSDPDIQSFDVVVYNQDSICKAKIDGPWLDNHEFKGTPEKVFHQLEEFFQEKALGYTRDEMVLPEQLMHNIRTKVQEMQTRYHQGAQKAKKAAQK